MRSDRWLGPVIVLVAAVWLALSYLYIPGSQNEGEPGPRAFPVVLGVSLLGLGILMSVTAVARRGKADVIAEVPVTRREVTVVASTFGVLMLYAFLMDKAGFLVSTPIAILLMMYGILGMRNWLLMLSMAVGVTGVCWLLFVKVLGATMPYGSWLWLL